MTVLAFERAVGDEVPEGERPRVVAMYGRRRRLFHLTGDGACAVVPPAKVCPCGQYEIRWEWRRPR